MLPRNAQRFTRWLLHICVLCVMLQAATASPQLTGKDCSDVLIQTQWGTKDHIAIRKSVYEFLNYSRDELEKKRLENKASGSGFVPVGGVPVPASFSGDALYEYQKSLREQFTHERAENLDYERFFEVYYQGLGESQTAEWGKCMGLVASQQAHLIPKVTAIAEDKCTFSVTVEFRSQDTGLKSPSVKDVAFLGLSETIVPGAKSLRKQFETWGGNNAESAAAQVSLAGGVSSGVLLVQFKNYPACRIPVECKKPLPPEELTIVVYSDKYDKTGGSDYYRRAELAIAAWADGKQIGDAVGPVVTWDPNDVSKITPARGMEVTRFGVRLPQNFESFTIRVSGNIRHHYSGRGINFGTKGPPFSLSKLQIEQSRRDRRQFPVAATAEDAGPEGEHIGILRMWIQLE